MNRSYGYMESPERLKVRYRALSLPRFYANAADPPFRTVLMGDDEGSRDIQMINIQGKSEESKLRFFFPISEKFAGSYRSKPIHVLLNLINAQSRDNSLLTYLSDNHLAHSVKAGKRCQFRFLGLKASSTSL